MKPLLIGTLALGTMLSASSQAMADIAITISAPPQCQALNNQGQARGVFSPIPPQAVCYNIFCKSITFTTNFTLTYQCTITWIALGGSTVSTTTFNPVSAKLSSNGKTCNLLQVYSAFEQIIGTELCSDRKQEGSVNLTPPPIF